MCDTLVSLTDDGVLFAKNSDRDPNEAQVLRWHPAADHEPDGEVACTWTSIPQVAHTHAVVLSQPWWMWGAEMGANGHGVVIGNEAVFTKRPQGPPSLLGMDLLRLALERATTAADAVQVLVELLERHGQGGACSHERPGFSYHNSFLVADPDGAIVLETADRHWATEEVRGPGRSISNGLTIDGFAE
nr:carcinine hydrolase/isopenicillin-N N-acyltransferase family protein [Aquihabitans sp.]